MMLEISIKKSDNHGLGDNHDDDDDDGTKIMTMTMIGHLTRVK